MKTAVITLAIGEKYKRISELTQPLMRRYAEKIGSDFIVIDAQKISQTTPHWEKFQVLHYLEEYDRILLLDADIVVRRHCPNIFDLVPESQLGAFNEAPFVPGRDAAIENCAEAYGLKDFKWNGKYYNTGVLVVSKYHRFLFRKPDREVFNFYEQSYLNLVFQRLSVQMFDLPYAYNRMSCMDKFLGKDRYESYMIHYAGVRFSDMSYGLLRQDIEVCEKLPDDYVSRQRIWIIVQGGIGDQIQAEPTVRFLMNNIWKDADIRVSTHFPEIFAHLPIICRRHDEKIWDTDSEPFSRVTLPGPETIYWKVVSHLMCHTVDFCSMAVLARILPDIDKTPNLYVSEAAKKSIFSFCKRTDFSDCVLVHAGRHWQSKTFPLSWWQEVVDGIIAAGLTPILVGKDSETQGVLNVDCRGKGIDLTNLLSLEELFAVVSLVPILVSNDSSPIHIAGAFDNWIILIPTCKHPDHVLPYRHGSKSYKTAALYKKIALDDLETSPTTIAGSTADKLCGDWQQYLPEVDTVLEKIREMKNS